jgi:hypothetical protein
MKILIIKIFLTVGGRGLCILPYVTLNSESIEPCPVRLRLPFTELYENLERGRSHPGGGVMNLT